MNIIENQPVNPKLFKSLGQVAKQIGISRPYLSEKLHVEIPNHFTWPSLQRIDGGYVPAAFLIAARLAKLNPLPVYEAVAGASPADAYAIIDACAYALARVAGVEGDAYVFPRLDRKELVFFLRAVGDALTASLAGLEKPSGYGDQEGVEESQDEEPHADDADDADAQADDDEPQAADADDAAVEP